MKKMLINAIQQEELRVAIIDGRYLCDLDVENVKNEQKKSNIYKGRIVKIEPSLNAVFVDYGSRKHGFLPVKEISDEYFFFKRSSKENLSIKEVLKEGQEIIIQVDKDERGNKGAALTTFISLAGSYLVLMPNNPKIEGISRKILGEDRIELKEIISSLEVPKEMGLIVRTAGLGKSVKILQRDLQYRINHWKAIKRSAERNSAPFLIHQESNVIIRAFRDLIQEDIEEIIIDKSEVVILARNYIEEIGLSGFSKRIKFYNKKIPLFSYYGIESQIESALKREVRLPSGGSLVIDSTEALTAIDINSSRSTTGVDIEETAFNTNLEAVDEISRQLKIRDLGGLIVIDFIDMSSTSHIKEIENHFKDKTKNDRARIQIGKISRFGLLEMSRQRLSSPLYKSICCICPRCKGEGIVRNNSSISLSILRTIEEEISREDIIEIHVVVPIPIASYLLNEKRHFVNEMEKRKKNLRIVIIPNEKIKSPNYNFIKILKKEKNLSFKKKFFAYKHHKKEIFKKNEKLMINNYFVKSILRQKLQKKSDTLSKEGSFSRKRISKNIFNQALVLLKDFYKKFYILLKNGEKNCKYSKINQDRYKSSNYLNRRKLKTFDVDFLEHDYSEIEKNKEKVKKDKKNIFVATYKKQSTSCKSKKKI
ncbi:hypothetical protein AOQ88_01400 [Candidatus Riesia sp. GBBU]|nr:hypothetical protein AOQ88_01400 [Candidatus Riesia sp. GBBU]